MLTLAVETIDWSPSLIANTAVGVILGGIVLWMLFVVTYILGGLLRWFTAKAAASGVARYQRERSKAETYLTARE